MAGAASDVTDEVANGVAAFVVLAGAAVFRRVDFLGVAVEDVPGVAAVDLLAAFSPAFPAACRDPV